MKMSRKSNLSSVAVILLSPLISINVTGCVSAEQEIAMLTVPTQDSVENIEEPVMVPEASQRSIVPEPLHKVCQAIIWVESRGDNSAVSSDGEYVGILQLGKLYVTACNQIQDSIVFSFDDRFDSIKSLQMFTIFQTKYNPNYDRDEAIRLHNPTAGSEYRTKVLQRFETIY